MTSSTLPKTIEWIGGLDGHVAMIDQRRLPEEVVIMECRDARAMWEAIKTLAVRGAPAIGIAAAMGAVLGVRDDAGGNRTTFLKKLEATCDYLAGARPTAVNLSWALRRVRDRAAAVVGDDIEAIKQALLDEAKLIRDEDAAMCRAIGQHGAGLIQEGMGVMTYCNAGSLATAEYGTALAPFYAAHERGCSFRVFACETRPLLQGARLTTWELLQAGIDVTLLCDNMAASLMADGKVDLVITGADRIAANGDTANKIGTYGLAVLADAHGIPFYIAAPSSTFDLSAPNGSAIPIEYRDASEIRQIFDRSVAPPDVPCHAPAFDITPAKLIRGIVTEHGVIEPVDQPGTDACVKPRRLKPAAQ